ncbi:hypothetical protein [Cerasicoccus frondis]|uniref:hypothetical protein n=1 Tax=Cerasicoccus frondis TaxID=490090 RepID=UPI002852702D|nr:hypothetical protein [Cerasicoccus frondis]
MTPSLIRQLPKAMLLSAACFIPIQLSAIEHPELNIFSNASGNLIEADGALNLSLELSSWDPITRDYRIDVSLVDWDGKGSPLKQIPIQLAGENAKAKLESTVDRYGPFTIEASLVDVKTSQVVQTESLSLIRLVQPAPLTPQQRMNSSIGVNTHANAPWGLLQKMGIHWARDYSFGWLDHKSRPPIASNSENFTKVYQKAYAADVIILPCMQRSFRENRDVKFVADDLVTDIYEQLAEAFPDIPYWESENEYDTPMQKAGTDTVAIWGPYLQAANEGLERSRTGAKLAMNGRAGIHMEFTRELLESEYADDFEIVNYHYYTGTIPPEISRSNMNNGVDPGSENLAYLDQLRAINQLARKHDKEAWLTECGYDVTYGPAVGLELQATYLPRVYLTARWSGTDKVFWYFDRDVRGSTQKFGSCGLYDLKGHLRPSAAAMAALSRETAAATMLGRIDAGDTDAWCLVLKKDEGGYVLVAWTVSKSIAVPAYLQKATAVYDMFGNTTSPEALGPEVHYFHLSEIPSSWDSMLATELVSPSVLEIQPGGSQTLEISMPAGAKLTWRDLPPETVADHLSLKLNNTAPTGEHPIILSVETPEWTKSFALILEVTPVLAVETEPYTAGATQRITVTSTADETLQWTTSAANDMIKFQPGQFTLAPGATREIEVYIPESQSGPCTVSLTTDSGIQQKVTLRPMVFEVPDAPLDANDPFITQWPDDGIMNSAYFVAPQEQKLQAKFAWSEGGLALAVKLPSPNLKEGNPINFWDGSNIELLLDTEPNSSTGWTSYSHHFYFVPVKQGDEWTISAGEWKRSDAIRETIRDDKRVKTQILPQADGYVVMAFIPADALKLSNLKAGSEIAAGLAVKQLGASDTQATNYAWPRAKENGLLDGVQSWGRLRLTQ